MGLLTPEYMALQKQLHATGTYGRGVDAQECADLLKAHCEPIIKAVEGQGEKEDRPAAILDYGCGNGHLKPLLSDYDVREYDPCIEGKASRPEPADWVICADVLEHVEPDCLDTVFTHLNEVTNFRLIAVIATRPSQKVLADGRNAHLIVESPEWWKSHIGRFFRIEKFEDRHEEGKGILVVAEPIRSMDCIRAFGVYSDKQRNEQTAKNVAYTLRRIPQGPLKPHKHLAIICCYGPSLRDTAKEIPEVVKEVEAQGLKAQIISVSGAHDFLRKKGIKPDWHTECDPRPHKSKMIKKFCKKTKYLMASCCDPDFVKRIADAGNELILWHVFNGQESYDIRKIPGEEHASLIPGGGSIALRTMTLFYFLGFRNFMVHGFDCSFATDGSTHAGPHSGKELLRRKVRVGEDGPWFDTSPVMATYAEHMIKDFVHGRYPNCHFTFAGHGMFQYMLQDYIARTKALQEECKRTGEAIQPPENFGTDYFSMTKPSNALPGELWGQL
jgi:hypothetical protein